MTIEVRLLGPGDVSLVLNAAVGMFDHRPKRSLASEFLNEPRHHLVVAIDDGQVIGFVSAVHYIHPDKPAGLWINEVGVCPAHQARGVARQMLNAMLAHGRELGCRSAWVLTDRANTPAMRLYAGAGGKEEIVPSVMFEFALETEDR